MTKREYQVSYNGLEIGRGSASLELHGSMIFSNEPEVGRFECQFFARAATEGSFATVCRRAEDKLSEPWKRLKVTLGSSILLDIDQGKGGAIDPTPRVEKIGDDDDTGRTRLYRLVIEWGREASYNDFVRESSVNVAYTPARRREVTIQGLYTRDGDTLAREKYDTDIDAFCSTVLSAFGGTFELVGEPTTLTDTTEGTLQFQRVYRERIYGEAGSALDDADIVEQSFALTRQTDGIEAFPTENLNPLLTLTATYTCWLNKERTQDLPGKWQTIRDWIVAEARKVLDGSLAVMAEVPTFDYDDNRITATMTFLGTGDAEYLDRRVEVRDDYDLGRTLIGAHTGKPFSYYTYQGFAVFRRQVVETFRKLGEVSQSEAHRIAMSEHPAHRGTVEGTDLAPHTSSGQFLLMGRPIVSTARLNIGTPQDFIEATDVQITTLWQFIEQPGSITNPPSGGGGGPTITP